MITAYSRLILLSFIVIFIFACNEQDSKSAAPIDTHQNQASTKNLIATAQITNPSSFPRSDQSQYFSYYDLGLNPNTDHNIQVNAIHSQSPSKATKRLPSEAIDKNADGIADGVLIRVPLLSEETIDIALYKVAQAPQLTKYTQAEVSHKTGGEWREHSKYPNTEFKEYVGGNFENVTQLSPPAYYTDHSNWIRYEGPGIESDQVAYRIYADWRNGFDIFGKLTPEPILQKVGQDGYQSYHEMQDWGMDILKVGQSLGAGGFGLWHNDTLELISTVDQHAVSIIENGALRSSLAIEYKGWKSSAGKQDLSATFSMHNASSLVHTSIDLSAPVNEMAMGVVKHKNTELIVGNTDITGKAYSYIASWGNQALDGSPLGMAIFFRKENLQKTTSDDSNYIAVLSPMGMPTKQNPDAQQVSYYFDATWAPQSGINTKEAYINYLDQQAEKLTIAPRVRLNTTASQALKEQTLDASKPLEVAQRMVDSELKRKGFIYNYDGWDINRRRLPKFEYDIVGLYPQAMYQLGLAVGLEKYKEGIKQITGSFIEEDGNIKRYKFDSFNIDSVAPGVSVLSLYEETKLPKFKLAADLLRKQLIKQPRTSEGAFWHKQKYPYQLWLDGVYMGMPFMAEYEVKFNNGEHLAEVVKEFELTERYLRDAKTGLYFHAWDEKKQQAWAHPNTGLSPEIWARGAGWFAMALVDVLDIIPDSSPELRLPLLRMTKDLAAALTKYQDTKTGTWWQIMDKPNTPGNYRESSASAMFTYFLAKAVTNGYIDSSYVEHTKKAYNGLINEFTLVHQDGTISMTNQCYVAGLGFGRDGSYYYYMTEPVWQNDPKGVAPFIFAGIATSKMLEAYDNEQ